MRLRAFESQDRLSKHLTVLAFPLVLSAMKHATVNVPIDQLKCELNLN